MLFHWIDKEQGVTPFSPTYLPPFTMIQLPPFTMTQRSTIPTRAKIRLRYNPNEKKPFPELRLPPRYCDLKICPSAVSLGSSFKHWGEQVRQVTEGHDGNDLVAIQTTDLIGVFESIVSKETLEHRRSY
jgi:hypothetical protein